MRKVSTVLGLLCCGLVGCGDSDGSPTNQMTFPDQGTPTAGTTAGNSAGTSGAGASGGMAAGAMAGGPSGMQPSQGGMMGMNEQPPAAGGDPAPVDSPDASVADSGGGEPAEETCAANMEPNPADADPCTAPLRPNEDRLCEFEYNGQTRIFYIYAPASYNACKPAAMVMDAHGASESAEVHIGQARFSADAPLGYGSSWRLAVQGDNAIVVTPEGIGLRWSRSSDPAFLNTVADMVEAVADVDPEKVYITGISMGGMITVETACQDTNRWRGMSPVAMLSNTCGSIDRPIPHIAFHAPTDALTSYADDERLAEQMVELNNCDTTPETVYYGGPNTSSDPVCFAEAYGVGSPDAEDPYNIPLSACPTDRAEASCQVWTGCDEGVEVQFCTVPGENQELGGHLLYRNDTSLALGPMAWQFFKKFWP